MKLILHYPDPCPSPPREEIGRLCYQNTIAAQEDLDLTKVTIPFDTNTTSHNCLTPVRRIISTSLTYSPCGISVSNLLKHIINFNCVVFKFRTPCLNW